MVNDPPLGNPIVHPHEWPTYICHKRVRALMVRAKSVALLAKKVP